MLLQRNGTIVHIRLTISYKINTAEAAVSNKSIIAEKFSVQILGKSQHCKLNQDSLESIQFSLCFCI